MNASQYFTQFNSHNAADITITVSPGSLTSVSDTTRVIASTAVIIDTVINYLNVLAMSH